MKGKKMRHRFCMWLLCMSCLIPYTLPPIYLAYIPYWPAYEISASALSAYALQAEQQANYKPGLSVSHTYSFVFDQIVSNWGAAIILLDNIHFNGVSIFSHLTFQLGRAGFPWNNGGFMFKNREKVLMKIRKILHYSNLPGYRPHCDPDTEGRVSLGHKSSPVCIPDISRKPNSHLHVDLPPHPLTSTAAFSGQLLHTLHTQPAEDGSPIPTQEPPSCTFPMTPLLIKAKSTGCPITYLHLPARS